MKRVCIVAALLLDVAAAAGPSDKWWPDFGANAASSHFVESEQITRSNVAQLEVAWFYPYGQTGFNPIVLAGGGAGLVVAAERHHQPRHQLLGQSRGQGPPARFRDQRLHAGD